MLEVSWLNFHIESFGLSLYRHVCCTEAGKTALVSSQLFVLIANQSMRLYGDDQPPPLHLRLKFVAATT